MKSGFRIRSAALVAAAAAQALLCPTAHSQANIWNAQAGNTHWHDPGNWSLNAIPSAQDEVILANMPRVISLQSQVGFAGRLQSQRSGFEVELGTLSTSQVSVFQATLRIRSTLVSPADVLSVSGDPSGNSVSLDGPILGEGLRLVAGQNTFIRGPAGHTGPTEAWGTLTVAGPGGALTASPAVRVLPNAILELRGPAAIGEPAVNRVPDDAAISIRRSSLVVSSHVAVSPYHETVGTLDLLAGGGSILVLSGTGGAIPAGLRAGAITRATAATAFVSADLERSQFLRLATPPVQVGGGTAADALPVVPFLRGSDAAGMPTLMTYDRGADPDDPTDDPGLRPLRAGVEFSPTFAAGRNVRLTAPESLAVPLAVNSLTVAGAQTATIDADLSVQSGALLLAGAVAGAQAQTLTGSGRLHAPGELIVHAVGGSGTSRYELNVPLTAAALTKAGNAGLLLGRANAFPGGVAVNEGRLIAAAPGALGEGAVRLIGGTIAFSGGAHVLAAPLSVENVFRTPLPFPQTPTEIVETTPAGLEVAGGSTVTLAGGLVGSGDIDKSGAGVLRILGDQAPDLFVLRADGAGTVEIAGTIAPRPGSGGRVSFSGATLAGRGRLDGPASGSIAPGDAGVAGSAAAIAVRSYAPALTPAAAPPGNVLSVDLLPGGLPGEAFDQLVVEGGTVRLSAVSSAFQGSVLTVRAPLALPPGAEYPVIDNRSASAIQGNFTGLPEGTVLLAGGGGGVMLSVTYLGGDGNDVVLRVIPEPAAAASALALAAMALGSRRKRR